MVVVSSQIEAGISNLAEIPHPPFSGLATTSLLTATNWVCSLADVNRRTAQPQFPSLLREAIYGGDRCIAAAP